MATDKDLNDDLYGGDLYADLDLEELDATQLDEELEDVPDLQPVSDSTPAPAQSSTTGNYGQQLQQSQPQQQYLAQQQQQQTGQSQGQYGFGSGPSGQGQQGYGQGDGNDRLRSGDQPDEGKMFIGGLNWETTEENLRDYMSQYGPIEACTIMRDPNGRSRGFAFLTYQSSDSVDKVLGEVHHLDGKQIDPKRAIPRAEHERTAKVFVGGLAASVTSESLKAFLTQFGPVMDATVMFDRETTRSKGFAFATFGNEESVGVAMAASGVELEGKAIEIKKAQPRGSGNLPNKFNGQGGAVGGGAGPRVGGMSMMNNMGGGGMNMAGGGMNMGGMNMGMGNMGGAAAFDPTAMMMMYQNMMKSSGMGGMNMGGGVDPNAMAMMYQNMMKNMTGMNAPAINPNMGRGGMNMMNPMAGMMGGMGMGMAGMSGMAPGMGMGGYGGQNMGMNRPPQAARAVPNAPRGPAAMRTEGGTTPNGAAGASGVAGPMNGASGTGAQRYSTQGAARSRPY